MRANPVLVDELAAVPVEADELLRLLESVVPSRRSEIRTSRTRGSVSPRLGDSAAVAAGSVRLVFPQLEVAEERQIGA